MSWQAKLTIGSLLVIGLTSIFVFALPSLIGLLISVSVIVVIANFYTRRRRHALRMLNNVLRSVSDRDGAMTKVVMAFARSGPLRAPCYEFARRLMVGQEPIQAATQSGIPLQLGTAVAMTTANSQTTRQQQTEEQLDDEVDGEDSLIAYSQILYLTVTALVTCGVLGYLTIFVHPEIENIFQEFGIFESPFRWLMVGTTPTWIILSVMAVMLLLLSSALSKRRFTARRVTKWLPTAPNVAETKAEMLCGLAAAMDQGMPLDRALSLATEITMDRHVKVSLTRANESVQRGASPAESLMQHGWIDRQQFAWLSDASPQRFAELLRYFATQGIRDAQLNVRWLMGIVFPLFVIALGAAVLSYSFGFFGTLMQLIHQVIDGVDVL